MSETLWAFHNCLINTQNEIVDQLDLISESKCLIKQWEKASSKGKIAVIQNNQVFDKAGVTKTFVEGILSQKRLDELILRGHKLEKSELYAFSTCGLSLVFHPKNPFAPSVHLNYRYFEILQNGQIAANWFGGGSDLSPNYFFEEDCVHFHKTLRNSCNLTHPDLYAGFKRDCDEYFFIKHRKEHRGVGGIFFDDLKPTSSSNIFELAKNLLNSFISSYFPILYKRYQTPYNEENIKWQRLRRGRYVEFNLIYDKGTHFGLNHSDSVQIENVFISMPLHAIWEYEHEPAQNSEEHTMKTILQSARNWV